MTQIMSDSDRSSDNDTESDNDRNSFEKSDDFVKCIFLCLASVKFCFTVSVGHIRAYSCGPWPPETVQV